MTTEELVCEEVRDLSILSIIGFDGKSPNSLHVHPDGTHVVYPTGNAVVIQNLRSNEQEFLRGHNNLVTAVSLSPSGKYVASGQVNFMGYKALVIAWDFETKTKIGSYEVHKVRVEWLAFSCRESYLLSLGGRDDAVVVLYDLNKQEAICGALASGANTGYAMTIMPTNKRDCCFLTGGDKTIRVWNFDTQRRRLIHIDVPFNKIKRIINCIALSADDNIAYCGTTTGDIMKVWIGYPEDVSVLQPTNVPVVVGLLGRDLIKSKKKKNVVEVDLYSLGITAIAMIDDGHLLIGAGDGTIHEVNEHPPTVNKKDGSKRIKDTVLPAFSVIRRHFVDYGVTSMKFAGPKVYVSTSESEMYSINLKTWKIKLLITCHTSTIYDLCFPSDLSEVVATSSKDTVRIWNVESGLELLRITVANMTCSAIVFQHDGKGIISSWNDGKIRAFTPQTGQLKYEIHDAHNKGVSAIALTKDGKTIVSGGGEGQVRIWDVSGVAKHLLVVFPDHKGPVSSISINVANDEAVSSSTDGTCIIWDIVKLTRKNIIFANTLFMAVQYHPSDAQIVTVGTDKKISYWETFDGSLIREIEGSKVAVINTIDVSPCGDYFVTAGNDQILKLWDYQEGTERYIGMGHACIITKARFSPDGKYIVSVSADGALFRWQNPYYKKPQKEEEE